MTSKPEILPMPASGQAPADSGAFCLFQESWWLDAVAPGQWEERRIEADGRVRARWVLAWHSRGPIKVIGPPPLTPYTGLWIDRLDDPGFLRSGGDRNLTEALLKQLPRADIFVQRFHPYLQNSLPFQWAGFDQTTNYTYRLALTPEMQESGIKLSDNMKRDVRAAARRLELRDVDSTSELYRLLEKTLARRGRRPLYEAAVIERAFQACRARGCGRVTLALDAEGGIHAGVFIVWDEDAAYYLVGGSDAEHHGSAAAALLIHDAILRAAVHVPFFDFEGSMVKSIGNFFMRFGGKLTPFHRISKSNLLGSTVVLARDLVLRAQAR